MIVLLLALTPAVVPQGTKPDWVPASRLVEADGARFFLRLPSGKRVAMTRNGIGAVHVEHDAGRVGITRGLIESGPHAALAELDRLVRVATRDGHAIRDLTLAHSPLVGAYLGSTSRVVLAAGTLTAVGTKPPTRTDLAEVVREAVALVDSAKLNAIGKQALRATLENLVAANPADEILAPRLALRLIRGGWLRRFLGSNPTIDAIEARVRAALELLPVRELRGPPGTIRQYRNAVGDGAMVWRSADRCAYHSRTRPGYDLPSFDIVVELPAGADPFRETARATRIVASRYGKELARWSQPTGLRASRHWREIVQSARKMRALVTDYLPPHIVLPDLDGNVRRIFTRHGSVSPPPGRTRADADGFLRQAAAALPDAAHLDLIREHFFSYVHDSPDMRARELAGTPTAVGDIHQTVYETLASTTDGVFRGDCDDLAEVYQTIVRAQGKTSHIMDLPGHNALGFVTRDARDIYRTFVLHTGRPLEFADRRVTRSLARAYRWFAPDVPFDAAEIPIAVRFSGEDKRSDWVLSHRIFTEPDYARTMIDVQRDWHFHTFRRAAAKVEKLIATGDSDQANYREMAGLNEQTGQHAVAARYLALAMQRGPDQILALASRRVWNLLEAGDRVVARKEVEGILDRLPRVKRRQGAAYPAIVFGLVGQILAGRDHETALRVLEQTVRPSMSRQLQAVGRWLGGTSYNRQLWQSEEFRMIRESLRSYVWTAIDLVENLRANPDFARPTRILEQDVQRWVTTIALRDLDDPSDRTDRYAAIGAYHRATLGAAALHAKLAAAQPPDRLPKGAPKRRTGPQQLAADLRWILVSPSFWHGELARAFRDDQRTIDPTAVRRFARRVQEAQRNCERLGIAHSVSSILVHTGKLTTALLDEDATTLRQTFERVRVENDKWLRDTTATWIGSAARFLRPKWFRRVLRMWREEVDFKPSYFNIAWKAVHSGAPRRALEVAELAARLYPEDPAYAEERDYLRALIKRK